MSSNKQNYAGPVDTLYNGLTLPVQPIFPFYIIPNPLHWKWYIFNAGLQDRLGLVWASIPATAIAAAAGLSVFE